MIKKNIKLMSAFTAFFAAVICVSCFIKIVLPFTPIPIVLQNAMCVLTGVLLGSFYGGAPSLLWLIAGLIGLPVYSGGTGGFAVWLGPTGGFLPGYFLGALIAGLISGKPSVKDKKPSLFVIFRVALGFLAGMVIMYVPGLLHFAHWALGAGKVPADKSTFAYVMGVCCIPYIPGDLIKSAVCIPAALLLRPVAAQYLYSGKEKSKKDDKASENQ